MRFVKKQVFVSPDGRRTLTVQEPLEPAGLASINVASRGERTYHTGKNGKVEATLAVKGKKEEKLNLSVGELATKVWEEGLILETEVLS